MSIGERIRLAGRWLARFPGATCPRKALTGDDVLDGYMRDLDAHLHGSSGRRMLILAEMRDNLQQARDAQIADGIPVEEASRAAVRAVGPVEEYAAPQRKALLRKFTACAILVGLSTGVLAALAMVIQTSIRLSVLGAIRFGVVQGVTCGPFLAWVMLYVMPAWELPQDHTTGETFSVRARGWTRGLSYLWAVVFGVGAPLCLATGIIAAFRPSVTQKVGLPWWGIIAYSILIVLWFLMVRSGCSVLRVERDGFSAIRLLRRRRKVKWGDIVAINRLGEIHPWIPGWMHGLRNILAVETRSDDGRRARVHVYPGTVNADRLLLLVEEKTGLKASL